MNLEREVEKYITTINSNQVYLADRFAEVVFVLILLMFIFVG